MRADGRAVDTLRPITIRPNFTQNPAGSVLIQTGQTMVLCTATIEEKVPPFLRGSGKGWVTAEYSLLPGSTETRSSREVSKGKVSGRTAEIQRLIGRSIRAVVDLELLGERTIWLDCDVLQADGGTRTASVNGAFVALSLAVEKLLATGKLEQNPLKDSVAAISVGVVDGTPVLDLPYEEDSRAEVDMNVVMTGGGRYVEIQGTGEEATFDEEELHQLLTLAKKGLQEIGVKQKKAIQTGRLKKACVLATRNVHKVQEIRQILQDFPLEILTIDDFADLPEVEEDGDTFEANALKKAKVIAQAAGCLALADDSGLMVDALNGQPGVYSARFAGEPTDDAANNQKLLHLLSGVPQEERKAQFVCTIALAAPDGKSATVSGVCPGRIAFEPAGEGGFGYDPLFIPEGYDISFAALGAEVKNAMSHRGRALKQLPSILPEFL